MTRDIERVGRIAQPFRNHQIDFEPPRITGKPTIFGVDKWIEEQNRSIASRFVKIVRQIEALYRKDAEPAGAGCAAKCTGGLSGA